MGGLSASLAPWLTPRMSLLIRGVGRSHVLKYKYQGCLPSKMFTSVFCLNPKRKVKENLPFAHVFIVIFVFS